MAQYLYILFPVETHQRYLIKRYEANNRESYMLKINGRGAIGDLYQGQKKQLAFFGDSMLFYGFSTDMTIGQRIKKKLEAHTSTKPLHVDEFATGDNSWQFILYQMQSLCRLKRFYNLVVVQGALFEDSINSLYYYRKTLPNPKYKLQIWFQLKKIFKLIISYNIPFHSFFPEREHYFDTYTDSHEIRQHPLFQNLFINKPNKLLNDDKKISDTISQIIQKSRCISNNLIWIISPYLYSDNMLESYLKLYIESLVIKKPNKNFHNFLFVSPKAKAQQIFNTVQISNKILNQHEVIFIDLFSYLQQETTKTPSLFSDAYHLSNTGAELVVDYMYPEFKKVLSLK